MPKNDAWGYLVLRDFGEARIGDVHKDTGPFVQPHIYRAPEVTAEIPWGPPVDIWNVATLVSGPICLPCTLMSVWLVFGSAWQIWDMFEGRHLFNHVMDEQGHY